MQILKSKWFRALCAFCWLALTALLHFLTPAREVGLEVTFGWWHYLRMAFQGLALVAVLMVLVLLFLYRRKLWSFLPTFRKFRPLLILLVRRDFLVKYKRSVLGVLWTMLNPMANMFILNIVFSTLFKNTVPYFPAFVLSGTVLFSCFTQATSGALVSIVGNANLLRKVYLPKYIFPFSNVVTAFVDIVFSLAALLIVMVCIGVPFQLSILTSFLVLGYLFVFCLGMGLLLSTAFVFFRDTQHLYGVLLTALNYLSAIFYDATIVPGQFMTLLALNPMYHYVRVFRGAMLYGVYPSALDHLICGGAAMIALCAGIYVFYRKQDQFILHV